MRDDYSTPVDFMVNVMQEFFGKDHETATRIVRKIHLDGKAVCGVYWCDVADTKVEQVLQVSRQAGYALRCVSEPLD